MFFTKVAYVIIFTTFVKVYAERLQTMKLSQNVNSCSVQPHPWPECSKFFHILEFDNYAPAPMAIPIPNEILRCLIET